MSRYLWCEDSGSGYKFWKEVFESLYPDIIVETKRNNTRLRTATRGISEDGNEYYIMMDLALDNPDVEREYKALKRNIQGKKNTHLIEVHSFEFALLSFEMLEEWVFATDDDLKDKRKELLATREHFIRLVSDGGTGEDISAINAFFGSTKPKNTEQIASTLLEDITRNTGFETNKSQLGPCFIIECCEWQEKQSDDICGLDQNRLSADEKKKQLVEYSVLKDAFMEAGL